MPTRVRHAVGHTWWMALTLAATLAATLAPATVNAQGTGRSMDFDLSIRSVGMGGASNGVFWDDLDHWGNPSLLGYAHGIRYLHTRTQLVPGLASNVFLSSDALQLGWGGFGIVLSGKPFQRGGLLLDYGVSQGTDPFGNPTGTFRSFERVKSWGAGISLARAIESVQARAGARPLDWSRYADVSVGMNSKDVEIVLGPSALGGVGGTSARDWGVHGRVTPIDWLEAPHFPPVRIDLAYGVSVLSYNEDAIVAFGSSFGQSPVTRHHRRGGVIRLSAGRMPQLPGSANHPFADNLLRGLTPLVSFAKAIDSAKLGGGSSIDFKTNSDGYEITLANVLSYRRGHYEDLTGQIDDDTWGWGAGLPIGTLGGVRYDDAHWPQARDSGLPYVHRRQWSVWLDPLEIVRLSSSRH
jgi:hypothetical protein